MKKLLLLLMFIPLVSFGQFVQKGLVTYSNTGKCYQVSITWHTGSSLNKALHTQDYNSTHIYAVIFWSDENVSTIDLGYAHCYGAEFTKNCLPSTAIKGKDQRGYDYEINSNENASCPISYSSPSSQSSISSYRDGLNITRLIDRHGTSGIAFGLLNNRLSIENSNKYENYGTSYLRNQAVQLDIYLNKIMFGFKYSFGETSFKDERSIKGKLYATHVETESFWLTSGFKSVGNLYIKVGAGLRSDVYNESLRKTEEYSAKDFSIGISYPIKISWFGIVPEVYYTKSKYLGYGLSLMF
jgi:hypothetical protein